MHVVNNVWFQKISIPPPPPTKGICRMAVYTIASSDYYFQ